jgi:RimJ/RimL family protein N-acetyltransferase
MRTAFKIGRIEGKRMIFELRLEEYPRIWPIVKELAEYNLFIKTVIEGFTPGRVLVDDVTDPRTTYMDTPEGSFVAGDPGNAEFNSSLREKTPYLIDLSVHPDSWERKVWEIIKNKAVRRHIYRYYTFEERRMGDWCSRIPPGYEFRRVDAKTLESGLKNIEEVSHCIENTWYSPEEFLEKGFCFIIVHGDTIVSRCNSDCVSGDRCELGIWTASDYRGRGFATLVAAGAVDHCLSQGISRIGWHCIDTNKGSIRVAEKIGFRKTKNYHSFGTELPAANASDLEQETWRALAEEYGVNSDVDGMFIYRAAECWALAGESARSMDLLNHLVDVGWLTKKLAYLLNSWPFEGLRGEKGWLELVRRLEKSLTASSLDF